MCPIHYHVKEKKNDTSSHKYLYYFISQGPVVSLNMYLKDMWTRNHVFGNHKVCVCGCHSPFTSVSKLITSAFLSLAQLFFLNLVLTCRRLSTERHSLHTLD